MMVSIDGYFEGSHREIDWHHVDAEYNDYAAALLQPLDAILLGRVTYELMAGYWPTAAAIANDPVIAKHMNELPKYVATHSLQQASWHHTTVLNGNITDCYGQVLAAGHEDVAVLGNHSINARR